MMYLRPRLIALLSACIAACAGSTVPAAPAPRASLIYVLVDGFRADYLDRGITPALSALADTGVRAEGLRPATPSVSGPNHYTLVTGLYPDRHGVVDNTFYDPELGMYGIDPATRTEPRFWEGATPLWITAARQGVRTASVYWAGSDVRIHGATADLVAPREPRLANPARVDQLLAWMDLPQSERPQLYLLYFESVDTAGHLHGPDAPETNTAIAEVDAAIARLIEGLRQRSLDETTNLVIVADHGMMDISVTDRLIRLSDLVDVDAVQETTYGATLGVLPRPGREAEVEAALLRSHEHMTCWRKSEIPSNYHYGSNPRVPAIFCMAAPGWTISTPVAGSRYRVAFRGNHGFDPTTPEMAGLFLAHGPVFRRGLRLPAFDNIHVYPLVAHALGIDAEAVDGSLDVLRPALRSFEKP